LCGHEDASVEYLVFVASTLGRKKPGESIRRRFIVLLILISGLPVPAAFLSAGAKTEGWRVQNGSNFGRWMMGTFAGKAAKEGTSKTRVLNSANRAAGADKPFGLAVGGFLDVLSL
jgi:hypothetical protein